MEGHTHTHTHTHSINTIHTRHSRLHPSGPEGTCFEGGVFVTELIFPPDYPLSPPKMRFISEIFHPNGKYLYSCSVSFIL